MVECGVVVVEKEKTRMEKTKVTKVLHFKTDLQGHAAAVYCLAFAPTGILLASGSFDNSIRLWDLANPAASCGVLNGHSRGVNCLAWSRYFVCLIMYARFVVVEN